LQPDARRLLASGASMPLGPRAFDLLVVLVERAGQLVTKDELLERVWPKLVVEQNNLPVQVTSLCKILGPASISTVTGHGYRFNLAVERLAIEPMRPSPIRRHNLPRPLTSFIGHEEDLDEYSALLGETRLLTLTGIGGCGKTRLAIKLGERMLPSFAGGVWYVDLAPLLDPERVPLTVATTLDVREESERSLVDLLCARIADRRMLLVLDNCEHLAAACAALVQRILSAAPGVRALAGSREGLGIPGERTVTVRSLSFPPRSSKHDVRTMTCEAVRLFVERARLSAPKFSLEDDTAEAVGEICRRLDGIPLAIELAAARIKLLSVEELRSRLDDRFRLLTGGSKAAVARQQTLLATIQWSYDHLESEEQQLLRRLSVFVGGWTLDGAARVATEQGDEYAVLDLLGRLIDRSLVSAHVDEGGTTRYSMLETVRQYAHERLNDAGEADKMRDRHLEFYVALAEKAEPQLVGPNQRKWFAHLESELENILAAHAWCDRADAFRGTGIAAGVLVIDVPAPASPPDAWLSDGGRSVGTSQSARAGFRSVPGALDGGRVQLLYRPV